jgi:hypothetical protein
MGLSEIKYVFLATFHREHTFFGKIEGYAL